MYTRVIPRDLFNEAKLLKCLGQLSLLIHNGMCPMRVIHDADRFVGFAIDQDQSDGSFYCSNLKFYFKRDGKDVEARFRTSLNSRENYPLCTTTPEGEEIGVFEADGGLTEDFLIMLGGI